MEGKLLPIKAFSLDIYKGRDRKNGKINENFLLLDIFGFGCG